MTTSYMQITDNDGQSLWIEPETVRDPEDRERPVAIWGDNVSSDTIKSKIVSAVNLIEQSFSKIPTNMKSVEVEFGLTFNYDQNFIIAKAGGKSHIKIKLTIQND